MTRQNQIDVKTVFISVCVLFVFLGCERTPRVRLVKDDEMTFHFQWNKPLKEERIILIHYSGAQFSSDGREIPFEDREKLVYFPAETFVSAPVSIATWAYRNTSSSYIDSVEILPAHSRETSLPAHVYKIAGNRFHQRKGGRLLRQHPFFREYRVDQPSRITFER